MSQFFPPNMSSPLPGATFIDDIFEPWAAAVNTNNIGSTRPDYVQPGTFWIDNSSTPWIGKFFQGTDDIIMGTLDPGTLIFTPSGGTGLTDIVQDTTPQLGGDLDVNSKKITSASNGNVIIEPNGTGAIIFGGNSTGPVETRFMEDSDNGSNYVGFKAPSALSGNKVWTLPSADGSANQFIKTDGSGNLTFGGIPMVELSSQSPVAATTVDFISGITSAYSRYLITGTGVVVSPAASLELLTSTNGGVSFDNSSGNYYYSGVYYTSGNTITAFGTSTDTMIPVSSSGASVYNTDIILHQPSASSTNVCVRIVTTEKSSSAGSCNTLQMTGYRNSNADVDAIRIRSSNGITGTFKLYGII